MITPKKEENLLNSLHEILNTVFTNKSKASRYLQQSLELELTLLLNKAYERGKNSILTQTKVSDITSSGSSVKNSTLKCDKCKKRVSGTINGICTKCRDEEENIYQDNQKNQI